MRILKGTGEERQTGCGTHIVNARQRADALCEVCHEACDICVGCDSATDGRSNRIVTAFALS